MNRKSFEIDARDAIFELRELAELAGISVTTAKNWTNGRTLSLPASIRRAKGRGSRNLYSLWDAYSLAFAYKLRKGGLSMHAVKEVFGLLSTDVFPETEYMVNPKVHWIVGHGNSEGLPPLNLHFIHFDPKKKVREAPGMRLDDDQITRLQFAVNIKLLMEVVNYRLEKILERRGELPPEED